MEHGDGGQMGGTSREGFLASPSRGHFMIVPKMEIYVVRIIARLLTSLNMEMAIVLSLYVCSGRGIHVGSDGL